METGIILFGGSFNPVHTGHIKVAAAAFESLNAEKLIFIPAKRSPFKKEFPQVTDQQRVEMLELSIDGFAGFDISDCELLRKPPSYTIETVQYFREIYGKDLPIYWLIGADMVCDLPKWYKIKALMDNCKVSIMNRGGFDKPDFDKLAKEMGIEYASSLQRNMINTPLIDISSTEIRDMAGKGIDVSEFVGEKVGRYIAENKLYLLK